MGTPLFPIQGLAIEWDFKKVGSENMPYFWGDFERGEGLLYIHFKLEQENTVYIGRPSYLG